MTILEGPAGRHASEALRADMHKALIDAKRLRRHIRRLLTAARCEAGGRQ
jgi:hypothetical protein